MDELSVFLSQSRSDIAVVTESWLNPDIDSELLSVAGYNLYRKDRLQGCGGGVCVFTSDKIPCKRRLDLENSSFECLWLWIRPVRLPRPLTGIILCAVYNPPGTTTLDQKELSEYIVRTTDSVRNQHPDCGVVILGDFNCLDITDITSDHDLKQLVDSPTRGDNILDLIISNVHAFYCKPLIIAPLGRSDHNIVSWPPKVIHSTPVSPVAKRRVHTYPRSSLDAFGRWISSHNWFSGLSLRLQTNSRTPFPLPSLLQLIVFSL